MTDYLFVQYILIDSDDFADKICFLFGSERENNVNKIR